MAQIDYFVDGSCLGNNVGTGASGSTNAGASRRTAYAMVKAVDGVIVKEEAALVDTAYPQTNQYAELCAFHHAFYDIQTDHPDTPVTVYSDSAYAIDCIMTWGPKWKEQGWKRKAGGGGKPLEHLQVIGPLVDYWLDHKDTLTLKHIAAHQCAAVAATYPYSGNARADVLAREKAMQVLAPA
jgi:ribonuclease HI